MYKRQKGVRDAQVLGILSARTGVAEMRQPQMVSRERAVKGLSPDENLLHLRFPKLPVVTEIPKFSYFTDVPPNTVFSIEGPTDKVNGGVSEMIGLCSCISTSTYPLLLEDGDSYVRQGIIICVCMCVCVE